VIVVSERPLSDRRPHQPHGLCWEVRAWSDPPAGRDVDGWRTLGWSATHDDAVVIARGVTAAHAYEFAEVWGPADAESGRSWVCERFPEPDADERRALWLRAAAAHYTDGIDLPHRTFADTV
jgi:hypothetical protein